MFADILDERDMVRRLTHGPLKKKNKFTIEDWAPKEDGVEDPLKKNKKKAKQRNQESDDNGEEDALARQQKEEERKMKEREDALKE